MIRHIPNALTVGRLIMTVVLLALVLMSPEADNHTRLLDIAFVLFVVAGLTDIVDGWMARRYEVTSKFGRIVDPLADKVLVCGSFICFAIIGEPRLFSLSDRMHAIIHWSVVVILLSREIYVTVLRQWAESKGINFAATASGKLKMFFQSFSIGTVLVKAGHLPTATWGYWFTSIVFTLMVVTTVYSGLRATQRKCLKENVNEETP